MDYTKKDVEKYFVFSETIDLRRVRIEKLLAFIVSHVNRYYEPRYAPERVVAQFELAGKELVLDCRGIRTGILTACQEVSFFFGIRSPQSTEYLWIIGTHRLPVNLVNSVYEAVPAVVSRFTLLIPEIDEEIKQFMQFA